jgi:hypothetical protein
MKAIRCREWGMPDVLRLEEAESASLKPHQVRVRVRARRGELRRQPDGRRHLSGQTAFPLYPWARSRWRDRRDRQQGRRLADRRSGARSAAQRRRLRRGNRTRRRCRSADPRFDGFRYRRSLPGCLWYRAFRADPSRPFATGRDAAGAWCRGRGRADVGRDRQSNGGAGHSRSWRRGKTGSGERTGCRRADRLSRRKHPRPGARADRWQRRRYRFRPSRR